MDQEHDKGFRDLLSNASVFVSLLKVFVKASWTAQVEPEQLELVRTSFITPAFEKREADIIYKLKRKRCSPKTGSLTRDIYFYCLLELQSSVDFSMPVRLLIYMVSFWIELLKNTPKEEQTRKNFRLPVIIPLVLYNGLEPWTVVSDFAKICAHSELFGKYALNFKYYLIDVNRLNAEELLEVNNALATVFYIDQNRGETAKVQFGRIQHVLPRVSEWPSGDGCSFLKWLRDVALPRLSENELLTRLRADLDSLKEEMDVSMFVSNFAVNLEKAMQALDRQEAELALTKEELTEAKARMERMEQEAKARLECMEQEKARLEQEAKARLEQEKARVEQEAKARMEQEKVRVEQETKARMERMEQKMARLEQELTEVLKENERLKQGN